MCRVDCATLLLSHLLLFSFLVGLYLACDQSPSWCIMTHSAAKPVYGVIIPFKLVPSFSPPCIPPNYVHILYTPFVELVLMRPLTV